MKRDTTFPRHHACSSLAWHDEGATRRTICMSSSSSPLHSNDFPSTVRTTRMEDGCMATLVGVMPPSDTVDWHATLAPPNCGHIAALLSSLSLPSPRMPTDDSRHAVVVVVVAAVEGAISEDWASPPAAYDAAAAAAVAKDVEPRSTGRGDAHCSRLSANTLLLRATRGRRLRGAPMERLLWRRRSKRPGLVVLGIPGHDNKDKGGGQDEGTR